MFEMGVSSLPPQVQALATRERQIATIVYAKAAVTAKYLEGALDPPLTNSAIRSMLRRLEAKGIIKCHSKSRGPRQQFVYVPAIGTDIVRRKVLQQFAEQYFAGSLLHAANVMIELTRAEAEGGKPSIGSSIGKVGTADVRMQIDLEHITDKKPLRRLARPRSPGPIGSIPIDSFW